jgi:catechol 2,3-dioxygenase-like lactoylglutathione lyase family enzyme
MIRGIHHVAIATGNLDRLVGFYRDVIGMEVMRESEWAPGSALIDSIVGLAGSSARTATLRAQNAYLELFQYRTPPGAEQDPNRPVADHGYTHFCLDVVDIDQEYERLVAAGMRFHCAPPPASSLGSGALRSTYGRDPDGNVIELQEILDGRYPLSLPELA